MKALVGAAVVAIIAGAAMLGIAHAQQAHQAAQRPDCHTRVEPPLPLPDGWTIVTHCGTPPVDGAPAITVIDARRIVVWPASIASWESLGRLLAHEAGHAWDAATLDDEERQMWRRLRGLGDGPWHYDIGGAAVLDVDAWRAAPGEDWADMWAACHGWPSLWFDPPTEEQCKFITEATKGVKR